jgi:hypothetical protein
MGDIPLWPFFLPSDHPNKRDSETLSTVEAQKNYAVNMIIPLIKHHLSLIITKTSNGLDKYPSLHTHVDSWLKKWAPEVDVKGFWQSIPKGYQPPSYGPGGPGASLYAPGAPGAPPYAPGASPYAPGASPYAPGASLYAPGAPGAPPYAPGAPPYAPGASPYAPGASPYAPGASPYAPGPQLTLRTGPYKFDPILAGDVAQGAVRGIGAIAGATAQGVQMTGECLGGAGQCLVNTGQCLAPFGECIGGVAGCCMQGGIRKKKRKTLRRRRCKKRTRKTRRV